MAIARVLKFAADGSELHGCRNMRNAEFAQRFPGVRGKRYDSFSRWIGFRAGTSGEPVPVVRIIEYKANPSLHKCDGRCLHAKGHTCECSCGGKNHGAGH